VLDTVHRIDTMRAEDMVNELLAGLVALMR
jgi:hypothetical protein